MIQSHELPEDMIEVNGVRKYRINIKEVITEESTYYTYEEVEFNSLVPVEITDRKVNKLRTDLAITKGDTEEARKLLKEYYDVLDEQEFNARLKEEYDLLFYEELETIKDVFNEETQEFDTVTELVSTLKKGAPTFEEYKNETRVITKAIEEVVEIGVDGNEVVIQEYVPEVTELVRPYIANDVTGKVEEYLANSELYKERIKLDKLETINNLVVSRYGVPLDAHDVARANMNGVVALANFAFIQAMVQANPELQPIYDAVYKTTKTWKGADNLPHEVQIETVAELGLQAMEEYANVLLK